MIKAVKGTSPLQRRCRLPHIQSQREIVGEHRPRGAGGGRAPFETWQVTADQGEALIELLE